MGKNSFSYKFEKGLLVVVTDEIQKYHHFEVPVNGISLAF